MQKIKDERENKKCTSKPWSLDRQPSWSTLSLLVIEDVLPGAKIMAHASEESVNNFVQKNELLCIHAALAMPQCMQYHKYTVMYTVLVSQAVSQALAMPQCMQYVCSITMYAVPQVVPITGSRMDNNN